MKITRTQLESMKPKPNWVLVKQVRRNDRASFGADANGNPIISHIDTSFEPMKHAGVCGVVQALPDHLLYQSGIGDTMEWDTDMELLPGDMVWFHYLDAVNPWEKTSLMFNSYWECEGEMYILVHYSRCFVARRSPYQGSNINFYLQDEIGLCPSRDYDVDSVFNVDMLRARIDFLSADKPLILPLNGYVLAEPVAAENKFAHLGIATPPNLQGQSSLTHARALYLGSCVREYDFGQGKHSPDSNDLNPGEVFVMDKFCDIPLEYDFHTSFEGKKTLYRVQRRHIFGVIENYQSHLVK